MVLGVKRSRPRRGRSGAASAGDKNKKNACLPGTRRAFESIAVNPPLSLSIVVPLQNEQGNVGALYQALIEALEPMGREFEIILVNDGSTDCTGDLLDALALCDARVQPLHLTRNFGQAAALSAGFETARGTLIVTLDGDLQNDPADIPRLLELLETGGYRVVSGWRQQRAERAMSRVLPSLVANWLIARIVGLPSRDNGCSLKCYRAEVVKGVYLPHGYHRYLPAILAVRPEEFAQLQVAHRPRHSGHSHYDITRLFAVLATLPALPGIKGGPAVALQKVRTLSRVACVVIWAACLALITRHGGWGLSLGVVGLLLFSLTGSVEAQLNEWVKTQRSRPFQVRPAAASTGPEPQLRASHVEAQVTASRSGSRL